MDFRLTRLMDFLLPAFVLAFLSEDHSPLTPKAEKSSALTRSVLYLSSVSTVQLDLSNRQPGPSLLLFGI